jgi:hypothetical protein
MQPGTIITNGDYMNKNQDGSEIKPLDHHVDDYQEEGSSTLGNHGHAPVSKVLAGEVYLLNASQMPGAFALPAALSLAHHGVAPSPPPVLGAFESGVPTLIPPPARPAAQSPSARAKVTSGMHAQPTICTTTC